jgi:hypothetical protein
MLITWTANYLPPIVYCKLIHLTIPKLCADSYETKTDIISASNRIYVNYFQKSNLVLK